jgi:hypothetical protein
MYLLIWPGSVNNASLNESPDASDGVLLFVPLGRKAACHALARQTMGNQLRTNDSKEYNLRCYMTNRF